MPNYFDIYKQRVAINGSNEVESRINATKYIVTKEFKKSPFYKEVIINNEVIDVRMVDGKNSNVYGNDYIQKQLLFLPDTKVDIGEAVYIANEVWLIVDFNNYEIFPIASIQLCNETLKWKINTSIYEYPCIITKSSLMFDLKNEKYEFNLPDGNLYLYVQKNEYTKEIIPLMRFILGSQVYEILGVDDLTNYNLIKFTINLTTKNSNDDFVNKIANNVVKEAGDTLW